ncbi:unnamed protein product [Hydatigera taeniaeformis]|uniref:RUN domain-containing protein n=1 Tax=Hydatigena taeniaeformis TaxID=6205 RepID=A0A0R3WKZ0_HYDTA|nr:unnamed protein product [Hydatigera taeniaeformis]
MIFSDIECKGEVRMIAGSTLTQGDAFELFISIVAIYSHIRKFHENPDLYHQPYGAERFTQLLSRSRQADAEFIELTSKAAWGWLFITGVLSHLKERRMKCILGDDLLELHALFNPNQFIASFTSLDAAKDAASIVNSRCDLGEAVALVMHETEAVELLLGASHTM